MSDTHDMGCERALKRLVEFVDGELPESEHDGVEQHSAHLSRLLLTDGVRESAQGAAVGALE